MPDRVEQVGLAQPGLAVDEQRVVGLGRRLGDRDRGGVGEPVARADDEGVEGVLRVEPGPLDLLGDAPSPDAGYAGRRAPGQPRPRSGWRDLAVGVAVSAAGRRAAHRGQSGRVLRAVDLRPRPTSTGRRSVAELVGRRVADVRRRLVPSMTPSVSVSRRAMDRPGRCSTPTRRPQAERGHDGAGRAALTVELADGCCCQTRP